MLKQPFQFKKKYPTTYFFQWEGAELEFLILSYLAHVSFWNLVLMNTVITCTIINYFRITNHWSLLIANAYFDSVFGITIVKMLGFDEY